MMVLNEAIIHLKDVTSLNFSVDGNIVFRQVGEFLHVYNRWKSCRRPNDNTARVHCMRAFFMPHREEVMKCSLKYGTTPSISAAM